MSTLLDTITDLAQSLAKFPLFLLLTIFGVVRAVVTDFNTLLLALGAGIGVVTIGLWVLTPTFALYSVLRVFSEHAGEVSKQLNFMGRVYRDNV